METSSHRSCPSNTTRSACKTAAFSPSSTSNTIATSKSKRATADSGSNITKPIHTKRCLAIIIFYNHHNTRRRQQNASTLYHFVTGFKSTIQLSTFTDPLSSLPFRAEKQEIASRLQTGKRWHIVNQRFIIQHQPSQPTSYIWTSHSRSMSKYLIKKLQPAAKTLCSILNSMIKR